MFIELGAAMAVLGAAFADGARGYHGVDAGPVSPWPAPIPARSQPAPRDELFVMTLGPVQTPLADATFDPAADRLTRRDGTVIEHYFRDVLGVEHYAPIDKSVFAVPPSGWCSWYQYYQEITPEEVLHNARWIAEHLRPFGAKYVQLDDGWQGTGHGLGENRDWTTIDARFRSLGMEGLAREIRALGLEPGIWLAPHGQSNERVVRDSGAFLLKPDGSSASNTWEGLYLLDPSRPEAHRYLHDLFTRLRGCGFTYFKIDGQPIVLQEYETRQEFMRDSGADGTANQRAVRHYRATLDTIRSAIGRESYLLGCWGIPLAGAGIMNGSRTAGDVVPAWSGFLVANDAVQRWNFLHNIVWYCDPDTVLVRPPLSDGVARCWATILGLSGQALLNSDCLPDLPEPRVELLRRIYPAVDIRPLDLFEPEATRKPVWVLHVAQPLRPYMAQCTSQPSARMEPVRRYTVVGVFNYDAERARTQHVAWERIGLAPGVYHVYDFWQRRYLGAWEHGVFLDVSPADVRVVTVVQATDRPVLLSTSRHITQGWVDLAELSGGGDALRPTLAGSSRVIAGDPYTLTIGLPRSAPTYKLAAVRALDYFSRSPAQAQVRFASRQGWATVTIDSAITQEISWELEFVRSDRDYVYPVAQPGAVSVTASGLADARASWSPEYHPNAAYLVLLDSAPLGFAFSPGVTLRGLRPGTSHTIGVRSARWDGSTGGLVEEHFAQPLPREVYLSEIEPVSSRQDWGELGRDKSVENRRLRVAGVAYTRGLGTHAASTIRYDLYGAFAQFRAAVGIDDEITATAPVSAIFEIAGDGRVLWTSEPVRSGQPASAVEVDVRNLEVLELRVRPAGESIDYLHADWLDARLLSTAETQPSP